MTVTSPVDQNIFRKRVRKVISSEEKSLKLGDETSKSAGT
jgi:hypothetical protein